VQYVKLRAKLLSQEAGIGRGLLRVVREVGRVKDSGDLDHGSRLRRRGPPKANAQPIAEAIATQDGRATRREEGNPELPVHPTDHSFRVTTIADMLDEIHDGVRGGARLVYAVD
jgi:hypothetical protein